MPDILAIDPGLNGALAFLSGHGKKREVIVLDMPIYEIKDGKHIKRHIDRKRLLEIFRPVDADNYIVFIESQQAYPGQGAVSNYSTGFGFGLLLMLLDAFDLSYEIVHPKAWQKQFSIKGSTKGQACAVAERLFPGVTLRGPRGRQLDGRADALLIGVYGQRKTNGEAP